MSEVSREMPRYKCHKEVWALKIESLASYDDGSGELQIADDGYAPVPVGKDWMLRCKALETGDMGYYIVYDGGYTSWSPTEAFEAGYTRM